MIELKQVFLDYLSSATMPDGKRRKLTPNASTGTDKVVTDQIPQRIKEMLSKSGRAIDNYRVYGSVGQLNYYQSYIPWVAILRRDVTLSTERGFYVVVLFSEDMQSCYLSLNQGFRQYQDAFGDFVGAEKVAQAAKVALNFIECPTGFVTGPIELAATRPLGRGYESGAIVSRRFDRGDNVDPSLFASALEDLLSIYDQLVVKLGASLIDHVRTLTNDEYQTAVNEIARKPAPQHELPAGPLPLPPIAEGKDYSKSYKRDPRMAARAIIGAGHKCEVDKAHETFLSRRTKASFVEAHHLIPMQLQNIYKVSLDVPENLVSLCPNCHRRLHHGHHSEVTNILKRLLSERASLLTLRGIKIDLGVIGLHYRTGLADDM